MQILGLSESTPKPENRAKTLFWPTIRNEMDVDVVTRQGFWICTILAIVFLAAGLFQGNLFVLAVECFEALFFALSGIGIRCRSITAAVSVFLVYFLSTFLVGVGVLRLLGNALLLANVRGTWLSARWRDRQTEPPPVPLDETFLERFTDRLPLVLWPNVRVFYYFIAAGEFVFLLVALLRVRLQLLG